VAFCLGADAAFFFAFIHYVVQLLKEVDKLLRIALFASSFRQLSPVLVATARDIGVLLSDIRDLLIVAVGLPSK
jgi:hypothetical protein